MTMLLEPLSPLFELQRDLHRLAGPTGAASSFVPPADVLVTEDDVTVHMDVPGLSAESLEIEVDNDVLTVRGERAFPYQTGNGARVWQRVERGFGRFERSLRVPRGLDADAIEAAVADGVLTLRLPKPEALKPRRIQIAASEAGQAEEQRELEGAAA
ncbi:MAG: Hsp20/alpha crystallin family protein [Actinomycetota bacterium]|nr:Hsp20/alpha crystallin family protein [Actinomycetota bacterium]